MTIRDAEEPSAIAGKIVIYTVHRVQLLLCSFLILLWTDALARPDMRPLPPNIAETGSRYYRFRIFHVSSTDGQRHYRIWTALPVTPPPASGYPVLYMLDGNAVMSRLTDNLLGQLLIRNPPVLVAIGYRTALPFDIEARRHDYLVNRSEKLSHRKAGRGEFLHLLESRIAMEAESGIPVNAMRRGLWGHSYGGIFVLGSWMASPFFQLFYSASPSLTDDNIAFFNYENIHAQYSCRYLMLMEGRGPESKIQRVSHLRTVLRNSELWIYPERTHGEVFNHSLQSALWHISSEASGRDCRE